MNLIFNISLSLFVKLIKPCQLLTNNLICVLYLWPSEDQIQSVAVHRPARHDVVNNSDLLKTRQNNFIIDYHFAFFLAILQNIGCARRSEPGSFSKIILIPPHCLKTNLVKFYCGIT